MIRDDPEALSAFRKAMKHQGKADDFSYNVREESSGNSRAYSLSRVQRECDQETVGTVIGRPGASGG